MQNHKSKFLIGETNDAILKKEKNFNTNTNNKTNSIPRRTIDLYDTNYSKNLKNDHVYHKPIYRQNVNSYNSLEYPEHHDRRSSIPHSAYGQKKSLDQHNKNSILPSNLNEKDRSHSLEYGNPNNNYQSLSRRIKPGSSNIKKVENLYSAYQVYEKKEINGSNRKMSYNNTIKSNKDNNVMKDFYNPSAKSVKEYSYKENPNKDYRDYMEDFCKIIDKFNNDDSKGLFCLYDGHGGSQPVNYVKERLPEVFSKFIRESGNTVEKALLFTFQKIDDELKLFSESQNVGTTACIVYFQTEKDIVLGGKRMLYSANVGDTRAILITSKEVKRLTYDHKCTDQTEADRIRKIGGIIFNGRLFGQLALSRALGDHALKKYGVTPTPCINKHTIYEKDRYVVICSDGVWDVLSDKDILDLVNRCNNSDELAKLIVKEAIDKGTQDNVSCIAIKIN